MSCLPDRAPSRLRRTFLALEVPEYRTFALAQLASIIGQMVQGVGTAWLVLRLNGGGVALGLVAGAQFLPLFLVGPVGGVLAIATTSGTCCS
jgi:hypothetical protein